MDLVSLETSFETIVIKKNNTYVINDDAYNEVKKLMILDSNIMQQWYFRSDPKIASHLSHLLEVCGSEKSAVYKLKLFECVNHLFKECPLARKPILAYLQKSLMRLLSTKAKPGSGEDKIRQSVIDYITEWASMDDSADLPQLRLCLDFVRCRFGPQLLKSEAVLSARKKSAVETAKKALEEKKRRWEHMKTVFTENKAYIVASVKIVESCLQLLIPDPTLPFNESHPAIDSDPVLFDGPDQQRIFDQLSQSVEFSGPSCSFKPLISHNVSIDIASVEAPVTIVQDRDNEDIISNLKDNMKLILKRYSPLLKNVIKSLSENRKSTNAVLQEALSLSENVLDIVTKYSSVRISHNELSFNLMPSDSENEDDDDFIDVL